MPTRNRWLIFVGFSLFLPTLFSAYFGHRSHEKYDQFSIPNAMGEGSIVVESFLGRLNFHAVENMNSSRAHFIVKGVAISHPVVSRLRTSMNLSAFYADYSFEWATLRNVSFLFAAFGFAIFLLLILINGRSRNLKAYPVSSECVPSKPAS